VSSGFFQIAICLLIKREIYTTPFIFCEEVRTAIALNILIDLMVEGGLYPKNIIVVSSNCPCHTQGELRGVSDNPVLLAVASSKKNERKEKATC
jgi:hypothetical protein